MRWQLNVGAEPVRVGSGSFQQRRRGAGNRFEMNIAAERMIFAQCSSNRDELFHCVVGRLHNSRTEEEAFDVVPAVEVEGELHDFRWSKPCAADVARYAIDAENTVIRAEIGEQDF